MIMRLPFMTNILGSYKLYQNPNQALSISSNVHAVSRLLVTRFENIHPLRTLDGGQSSEPKPDDWEQDEDGYQGGEEQPGSEKLILREESRTSLLGFWGGSDMW